MVARRQADRLSSPMPPARTRSGSCPQDGSGKPTQLTTRRRHLQVRAHLVARQQEDPLVRQEACACNIVDVATQEGHAGRPGARRGRSAITSGRRTASGSPTRSPRTDGMDKVCLYSLEQGKSIAGDRRLVRLGQPARSAATASICSSSRTATSTRSTAARSGTTPTATWRRIYFVTLAKDTPIAVQAEAATKSRAEPSRRPKPRRQPRRTSQRSEPKTAGDSRSTSTASRTACWRLPVPGGELPQSAVGRQHGSTTSARPARTPSRLLRSTTWRRRRRRRSAPSAAIEISADGKKMLVSAGRQVRHHRLAQGAVRAQRAAQLSAHGGAARSPGRVEADLQRMLAADARLLLRPRTCTASIGRRCSEVRAAGRRTSTTGPT